MKTTYLKPVTTTRGGTPLEYIIFEMKRDMRTRHCKLNEKYKIDNIEAVEKLPTFKNLYQKEDERGLRLIAPNGETAYKFRRELETLKKDVER